MEPKQKGNLTELQCITAFYSLGYQVSIPYGENSRYDFIADIKGKLIKVQVKSSKEVDQNSFQFSCRSCRTNSQTNIRRKYTKEEIDYFCTWYNNQCYLVPIEECSSVKILRINPPLNNNSNINWAEDYELSKMINKIIK